jgi:hypothetical protein
MKKEFIKYEQALALKELGFDEPCFGRWIEPTELSISAPKDDEYCQKQHEFSWTALAPLYQQAFRWFREKHNLYSEINLDSYKEPYSLKVTIKHLDNTNTFVDKEYYPYSNGIGDIDNKKYEEAEQACLDKLIEIVKHENTNTTTNR